jgi:hypothetical protein
MLRSVHFRMVEEIAQSRNVKPRIFTDEHGSDPVFIREIGG